MLPPHRLDWGIRAVKKMNLTPKSCSACSKDTPVLKGEKLLLLHQNLGNNWKLIEEHHLEKEYLFSNFRKALLFTNHIGAIAEQEGHHPDILLSYGKVVVQLWTHKIKGISNNDFILAAKCDEAILLLEEVSSEKKDDFPPPLL